MPILNGSTDGNVRKVVMADLKPGMILRPVDSNGYVAPFSDVVVTRIYPHQGSMWFDVIRPYAFSHLGGELHSIEKINMLGSNSLERYRAVLLASGEFYTCIIGD